MVMVNNENKISISGLIQKHEYKNIKEYYRLYSRVNYKNNKKYLNKYRGEFYSYKIICDCGLNIKKKSHYNHLKTKAHERLIKYKGNPELLELMKNREKYYNKFRESGDKIAESKYFSICRTIRLKFN